MTAVRAGRGGSADWRPGFEVVCRSGDAATVPAPCLPQPSLDYYLIYPESPGGEHPTHLGIVVEEFVLAEDYSAVGLNSAGWTRGDRHWRSSADISRGIRVDASLRRRVVGIPRSGVEIIYRQLGGGELPDEDTLRTYFHDGEPLPASAPLRLSSRQVAAGFHDTRVYRILFANGLDRAGLANLQGTWRMTMTADIADPQARVLGTAHRRIGDDVFSWDLRRISTGAAWCLDLTANLASSRDDGIGPLLRELTTVMRAHGLIPVTIERFS